jgi:uncharacterized membrane protein
VFISAIISIFALAFISFWPAMPSGIALGLAPVVVILTTSLSYAAGVALVLVLGKPLQNWLSRRFNRTISQSSGLLRRAWDRFGLMGLALLAPITVGAQVGAVIGLALNIPARKLFLAMTLGATLWSSALTIAAHFGLVGIRSLTG